MTDKQMLYSPAWTLGRTVTVILLAVLVLGISWLNIFIVRVYAGHQSPWRLASSMRLAQWYELGNNDTIDLRSLPLDLRLKVIGQRMEHPGELIRFTVMRSGARIPMTFRAPRPQPGNFYSVLIKRIAGTIAVLLAALLVVVRPSRMLWGFYLFNLGAAAASPLASVLLPPALGIILAGAYNGLVLFVFLITGLLVFVSRFPNNEANGWRHSLERFAFPLGLLGALTFVGPEILWENAIAHPEFLNYVPVVFIDAALVLGFVCLVSSFALLFPADRQKLKWVVTGLCIYMVARAVMETSQQGWFRNSWPQAWTDAGYDVTLLNTLEIVIPFTVGYAVLKHRVLDINFVISRALVYGVLTSLLVTMFAVLDWFFVRKLVATNLGLIAEILLAIAIGFWLNGLHHRIDDLVDRVFFKQRYRADLRLARAATALPHISSRAAVYDLLLSEPVDALDLASAAVFIQGGDSSYRRGKSIGWPDDSSNNLGPDDPVVLHLRSHLQAFKVSEIRWPRTDLPLAAAYPALALPIVVRNQVVSIALYGGHNNGADLDPDEVRSISRLAVAASAAYDHLEAQALRKEVESLRGQLAEAQIQAG